MHAEADETGCVEGVADGEEERINHTPTPTRAQHTHTDADAEACTNEVQKQRPHTIQPLVTRTHSHCQQSCSAVEVQSSQMERSEVTIHAVKVWLVWGSVGYDGAVQSQQCQCDLRRVTVPVTVTVTVAKAEVAEPMNE